MKSSPVSPGKLFESKAGGKRERRFLVLAVHLSGQRQQSLKGFEGTTPTDHVTLAEAVGDDWRKLGDVQNIPLKAFTDKAPAFRLIARRGPPITFMPGTSEEATSRVKRSHATLKDTGGARRSMNLDDKALKALKRIKSVRQKSTAEKLNDTKVVHALILEEDERLSAAKK